MRKHRKKVLPEPPTDQDEGPFEFQGEVPADRLLGPLARMLRDLDAKLEEEQEHPPRPMRSTERRTSCPWAQARRSYIAAHARAVNAWLKAASHAKFA